MNLEQLNEAILESVKNTRAILSKTNNVINSSSSNYNYTGICDESIEIFKKDFREKNKDNRDLEYTFKLIHGEQKHSISIDPNYWIYEHTWLRVNFVNLNNYALYVDPTCQQFKHIYADIPDYYVSHQSPK